MALLFIGFVASSLMLSCGQGNTKQTAETADSTKIVIDQDLIDSVKLLFAGESCSERYMSSGDYGDFANNLATSAYDTLWNESNIMVKMTEPDYTAIVYYKEQPADHSDWLMIWKENGRTKFRQKWFFLDNDKREALYGLFEKYRQEE